MPTPDILEGARLDRLADLLERRAVPFGGLGLEALDGLLSAVVLAPGDAVDCAAWQPLVWGKRPPRWENDDGARDVRELLDAHHALAMQRVRHDGDPLPARLMPLLWLPDDPDADHPDALDVGADWAHGFLLGMTLREAEWEDWLDTHAWIDAACADLDALASGERLAADPTTPAEPLAYRERLAIIASLPDLLADLHHHRIDRLTPRVQRRRTERPPRNAPCPCRSGRKYKKCCGA